jgi:hypothetical protein
VPGPPVTLFFGGARLLALYPLGPVYDGVGLNITVVSSADTIGFGFVTCPDVLSDVDALAAAVTDEFTKLRRAVETLTPQTQAERRPRESAEGADPVELGAGNGLLTGRRSGHSPLQPCERNAHDRDRYRWEVRNECRTLHFPPPEEHAQSCLSLSPLCMALPAPARGAWGTTVGLRLLWPHLAVRTRGATSRSHRQALGEYELNAVVIAELTTNARRRRRRHQPRPQELPAAAASATRRCSRRSRDVMFDEERDQFATVDPGWDVETMRSGQGTQFGD